MTTAQPEQTGITLYSLAVELGFDPRPGMNATARLRGAAGYDLVPLHWDRNRVLTQAEADAIREDATHWAERHRAQAEREQAEFSRRREQGMADGSSRFD